MLEGRMGAIDPSARIASGAVIGKDVEIGPYCVVGPRVTLGDGCRLVAHVSVMGHTAVGARTVIYPFASLGTPPQSTRYRGGQTRRFVVPSCVIRKAGPMHLGPQDG